MSKMYDTAYLRRIASSVLESAEKIASISKSALTPMEADIPSRLDGSAAKALEEAVGDLRKEVIACGKDATDIGAWLNHYAFELDEADEKAAQLFLAK